MTIIHIILSYIISQPMTEEELKKAQEELLQQQKAFAENQKLVDEKQKQLDEKQASIDKFNQEQEENKKKQEQKQLEEKWEFEKIKSDYENQIKTLAQEKEIVSKEKDIYLWAISSHFKSEFETFTKTLSKDEQEAVTQLIDVNNPVDSIGKLQWIRVLFAKKSSVWSDVWWKKDPDDLKSKMLDDNYRRQ